MSIKIYNQKNGALNEADRYELGRILFKAGYMVRAGKEKSSEKHNSTYSHYIEIWGDNDRPREGV